MLNNPLAFSILDLSPEVPSSLLTVTEEAENNSPKSSVLEDEGYDSSEKDRDSPPTIIIVENSLNSPIVRPGKHHLYDYDLEAQENIEESITGLAQGPTSAKKQKFKRLRASDLAMTEDVIEHLSVNEKEQTSLSSGIRDLEKTALNHRKLEGENNDSKHSKQNKSLPAGSIEAAQPQLRANRFLDHLYLLQNLDKDHCYRQVKDCFLYSFSPINSEEIEVILTELKKGPPESQLYKTNDFSLDECIGKIANWYLLYKEKNNEREKEHILKSTEDHIEEKSIKICAALREVKLLPQLHQLPQSSNPASTEAYLLDIGCGDCSLLENLSKKLGLKPIGVDIRESEDRDWGRGTKTSFREAYQKNGKLILYDGKDLKGALTAPLAGKRLRLVMLHHSLHHFPSLQAQKQALADIMNFTDEHSVIFITEHKNELNEAAYDLQHLLLELRYTIDALYKDKETQSNNISKLYKPKSEYNNYLSSEMLENLLHNCGAKLEHQMPKEQRLIDYSGSTFYLATANLEKKDEIDKRRCFSANGKLERDSIYLATANLGKNGEITKARRFSAVPSYEPSTRQINSSCEPLGEAKAI